MHFNNPEYLYLLFILPVFLLLFMYRLNLSRRVLGKYLEPVYLRAALGGEGMFRRRLYRHLVLLLAGVFLILALARPLGDRESKKVAIHGAELMLVVDVSRSMLVKDMGGVSRLQVMKRELRTLLGRLAHQRVGLVAFAGQSLLISPLTLDHDILDRYIRALSTNTLMIQGTNFEAALHTAWQAFRRGGLRDSASSRVILLASDGENNEKSVHALVHQLSLAGIRIFTLGLGSAEGGPIPVYDLKGHKTGYKKDHQGELVRSRFEGKTLQRIADKGGGVFYHVSVGGSAVEKIYSPIRALKKGDLSYVNQVQYKEQYPLFAVLALLCGAWYFLMYVGKGVFAPWQSYLKNL